MAKINFTSKGKEDEVVTEVETPEVETPEVETSEVQPAQLTKKTKELSANVQKVQEFLKSKGQEGATANVIAKHLELIAADATKEQVKKIEHDVRVIARKAVDISGGSRLVRNGRNKIYQIL